VLVISPDGREGSATIACASPQENPPRMKHRWSRSLASYSSSKEPLPLINGTTLNRRCHQPDDVGTLTITASEDSKGLLFDLA
jgi:hypothetical protein